MHSGTLLRCEWRKRFSRLMSFPIQRRKSCAPPPCLQKQGMNFRTRVGLTSSCHELVGEPPSAGSMANKTWMINRCADTYGISRSLGIIIALFSSFIVHQISDATVEDWSFWWFCLLDCTKRSRCAGLKEFVESVKVSKHLKEAWPSACNFSK